MTIGTLVRNDPTEEPGLTRGQSFARLAVALALLVFLGFAASWGVVAFVVALLLSIVLHEGGHYLGARWGGMKVTEYFIGFGPRIWSTRRGETEYGLKAIPLGAYVKVPGMSNLEEIPPEEEARTYRAQSYGRRLRMVFAGPAMNLLVALVLFVGFFAFHEEQIVSDPHWPAIDAPGDASPAAVAGLIAGDRVLRMDGVDVTDFDVFRQTVRGLPGETVPLVIERSGETLDLQVTLADRNPGTGETGIGFLGVSPAVDVTYVSRNLPEAVQRAFTEFGVQVGGTVVGIAKIFSPAGLNKLWQTVSGQRADNPTERASSIVGIVREGGRAAEAGWVYFIGLLGAVNLALGLFNLLPLLPLDGGHIVIATYERLRSRNGRIYRVDMAKVMPIFVVPLIILFTVVMGAFWLDITGS
ncbi:MAG TPA: site-2 protease family protein [Acidimicrobiales bacterium]